MLRKRENKKKKKSFWWVPTRPGIKNSKKKGKKFKKYKKKTLWLFFKPRYVSKVRERDKIKKNRSDGFPPDP